MWPWSLTLPARLQVPCNLCKARTSPGLSGLACEVGFMRLAHRLGARSGCAHMADHPEPTCPEEAAELPASAVTSQWMPVRDLLKEALKWGLFR